MDGTTKSYATPRVYKGESQYEKWLFTYLDIQGPVPGGKGKGRNRGQKNTARPSQ